MRDFNVLGSVEGWDSEWGKNIIPPEDGIEFFKEISCEMGLRKAGGLDWVMHISVTLVPGVLQCQVPVTAAQSPSVHQRLPQGFSNSPQAQTGTSTLGLLPRERASLSGLLAFRELMWVEELTMGKKRAEVQHEQ